MENYKVYPLLPYTMVRAKGCYVWDDEGNQYLDMYGGHAVIAIGHSHPKYVSAISEQVAQLGFYSNSVRLPMQEALAKKLGRLCGYPDYRLFLCNSGAEANENALKLASFHNQRAKIIAFRKGFHGRTSLAVAATDSPHIRAAVNPSHHVQWFDLGDIAGVEAALSQQDVAAVIIEGIQGLSGIYEPKATFLEALGEMCKANGTRLVLDEVQSGYGRTGKFFAHQYTSVKPDLITVAKGMGNGFPMGGVLISPDFEAHYGQLGTTFGGSPLACAAGLSTLEVIEEENLMQNSLKIGDYIKDQLAQHPKIKTIRGRGLLLGIECHEPIKAIRHQLLDQHRIFTGASTHPHVLRLLPPMCLSQTQADLFIQAFNEVNP